jgi:putative methanogenesis marker 16 metalloprotein
VAGIPGRVPEVTGKVVNGMSEEEYYWKAQKNHENNRSESIGVDDVDVVTTATRGVMSGTLAILSFPIADPGVFSRAEQVSLNGVPAHVGPCPNEHLGIVDLIIHGTAQRDRRYGGGHLFHDLIRGAEIDVVVRTPEKEILRTLSIDSIPYARMLTTRSAYRNYSAFVNPGEQAPSIFSVADFGGGCREAVFGGCGELNPLEKDHGTIGTGTRVLMNGAIGYVIGEGTRSAPDRRNLSLTADMHGMNGSYIGGFATSAGADVINSVAVPIPILDEEILSATSRLDSEIELPILDVQTRSALGRTDYSQVWSPDPGVTFDPARCAMAGHSPRRWARSPCTGEQSRSSCGIRTGKARSNLQMS